MKITQIFCDKCKTLIQERKSHGGDSGLEQVPDRMTIDVWSDVLGMDLVFCTVDCLKEYFKNVNS